MGKNSGASFGGYPLEPKRRPEVRAQTIRVSKETADDLQVIADLWNRFDRTLGKRGGRKWKVSSVIGRLLSTSVDAFWEQVGGRPSSSTELERFMEEAVQRVARAAKQK
jgi:hypothetical protein